MIAEPKFRGLLLSNSWNAGEGYLEHARAWILDFLAGSESVMIVGFAAMPGTAGPDYAAEVFASLGHKVTTSTVKTFKSDLQENDAIFVTGGNTFRLLRALRDCEAIEGLRSFCMTGKPYVGSSAGINICCPTIATTNDMPIIDPGSHSALGLLHFQVNPHYSSRCVNESTVESRDDRLRDFVLTTEQPVLGLPEGSALMVDRKKIHLLGTKNAAWFSPDGKMRQVRPGLVAV